jgi:hypothetical protein
LFFMLGAKAVIFYLAGWITQWHNKEDTLIVARVKELT